jgi:putative salt-induced outer membrane protein YdiY
MKRLLLTLLCIPSLCFAQVNVESTRLDVVTEDGLHTRSELGYDIKKGNTDVTEVKVGLRLDYIRKAHHTFLSSQYDYGYSQGATFKNGQYAHLRYTFMFLKPLGIEGFTQIQSSEFNDLKLRHLVGGSFRIEKKSKLLVFAIGVGGMFEYEILTYIDHAESWILRSTNYVSLRHKIKKEAPLQAYAILYIQPAFLDIEDFRILAESGIEYRLTKRIALKNSFNTLYDSKPPQNVGSLDLSNNLKVQISF